MKEFMKTILNGVINAVMNPVKSRKMMKATVMWQKAKEEAKKLMMPSCVCAWCWTDTPIFTPQPCRN